MRKKSVTLPVFSSSPRLAPLFAAIVLAASHAYAEETPAENNNAADTQQAAADKAPAAKENPEAPGHTLAVVTVSAQKRKESVQDVPSAVTAISGRSIAETGGGQAAGSVLQSVPNASGSNNDGNVRTRWWIRGLGSGDTSNNLVTPIGVYFDEVYINSLVLGGFPLFDIDQVEVLRGPQGTLWGKNTTGGAVSFVSRKPAFTPDGYAKIDLGNYGTRVTQIAAGGPINGDTLAGRISVYSQHQDGFGYNNSSDTEIGKKLDDVAVRGQLLAQITPDLKALLSFHQRNYSGDGENSQALGLGANGTNSYGYKFPGLGASYDRNLNAPVSDELSSSGATLNVEWQNGGYELTSISAFITGDRTTNGDGDYTPAERNRSHGSVDVHQFSQEFRLASPRADRFNWITGLHYFSEALESDAANSALPSTPNVTFYNDLRYHQDTSSYAIFGNGTYNFTEAFNLTAGLRWTSENKTIQLRRLQNPGGSAVLGTTTFSNTAAWWLPGSVSSPVVVNAVQDADTTWNDFTWDITPQYRLSKDVSVYGRIAKGFRGGTYNTGISTQADVSVVSPEYLISYETGLKSAWLDQRLTANAAIFYYDYTDIQVNRVTSTPSGTLSVLTNGPKASVKGAELEVVAIPVSDLRLNASLGLLRTEYTDYGQYTGFEFGRAPHVNALLGASYTLHLPNADEVVLQTDWNYKDDYFFSTTNQTDPNLAQEAYVLGNAQVSYLTNEEHTTLSLYVRNLTNEFYKTNAIPAAYNTRVYGLSDPRTFGVSILQRW